MWCNYDIIAPIKIKHITQNFNNNNNNNNNNINNNFLEENSNDGKAPEKVLTNIMASKTNGIEIVTRQTGSHSERVKAYHVKDMNSVQEEEWTLEKMAMRPMVISSVQWKVAQQAHTVLASFDLPNDLLISNIMKRPFEVFQYWRGMLELHVQVTGSPMHQGCLMGVFVPLTNKADANANIIPSFSSLSVNQHVMLQANGSTSACMKINFASPMTYLDSKASTFIESSLGTFYIVVLNPLQAASATLSEISVSTFARFVDSEFKVPRYRGQSKNSIGMIVQRALPKNVVADSVDALTGILGLDAPTIPIIDPPMKMLGTQYLNNTRVPQHIDKLVTDTSKMQEVNPETFATTQNEMEFDYLKSRYSYLGSFTVKSSAVAGTVVASFPINPCPVDVSTTIPNSVPLLQYLAMSEAKYRGGFKYKFQVVASSLHVAKFYVGVQYNDHNKRNGIQNISDIASQYGYAFELNQGGNEFEFEVPYVSGKQELFVPTSGILNTRNSLGYINVMVLNALAAPSNVVDNITVNVFIAGADDFQLSSLSAAPHTFPVLSKAPAFVGQSLIAPVENMMSSTEETQPGVVVAPYLKTINVVEAIGESYLTSLQDRCKKYQLDTVVRVPLIPITLSSDIPSVIRYNIMDFLGQYENFKPPPLVYSRNNQGLIKRYCGLFRAFKGPLRFKVVVGDTPIGAAFSILYSPPRDFAGPPDDIGNAYGEVANLANSCPRIYNQVAVMNSVQKTAEFEIPFGSNLHSIPIPNCNNNFAPVESILGSMFIIPHLTRSTTTVTDVDIQIYVAFGDESKCGLLYQVPRLAYATKIAAPYTSLITPSHNSTLTTVSTLVVL